MAPSLYFDERFPFLVYAVTSIHVGSGRSGMVVDLPIQRDPMQYPMIYSPSFKGALKQFCTLRFNAVSNNGRVNCGGEGGICCCLFGGEDEATEAASLLGISDLYPLAIPVPSLEGGYVYLTSKYLIDAITDLFQAVDYKEGIDLLRQLVAVKSVNKVTIGIDLQVPLVKPGQSSLLDTLVGLGSMAGKLSEGIAMEIDDDKAVLEIERGIIKYTRNKIDYRTGTVSKYALWTEEYMPHGTIFAGILFFNAPRRNKYCGNELCDEGCALGVFREFLSRIGSGGSGEFYLNVGGKETIGRGLVKVKLIM